jgi:hypothetical protein
VESEKRTHCCHCINYYSILKERERERERESLLGLEEREYKTNRKEDGVCFREEWSGVSASS